MNNHRILGVHLTERVTSATDVQKTLSAYGCNVRTRLGLHHVHDNFCSPNGLILLELAGDTKQCDELRNHLRNIPGVQVQEMVFDHPA